MKMTEPTIERTTIAVSAGNERLFDSEAIVPLPKSGTRPQPWTVLSVSTPSLALPEATPAPAGPQ